MEVLRDVAGKLALEIRRSIDSVSYTHLEASGRLDEVLVRLAAYFDRDYDLRQRIKGAMTYPAVIAVFAVIVVIILLATVVPSFAGVLEESGIALPGLTKALISIGRFIKTRWYVLIGALVLVVLGARYYVCLLYTSRCV